jgi:hypothetical protein
VTSVGLDQLRHEEVREALRHLGVEQVPAHRAGALRDLRERFAGLGTVRGLLDDAPEGARSAFVRLAQDGPATVEDLLDRGWWGHGVLPPPLDWLQRRALVVVDPDGAVHATAEARRGFLALTLDLDLPDVVDPAEALRVEAAGTVVIAPSAAALDRALTVPAASLRVVASTVAISPRSPSAVQAALRGAGVRLADDAVVTADADRPALPGTSEEAVGPRAVRALLSRAVDESRQVRLQYFASSRGGAATDRVVDPWTFGDDLLRGWCHLRKGERAFAVDRVGRARLLPTPVEHPAGTDA